MNIAVEAQPLTTPYFSGIPNYLKNVLLNLVRLDTENEYFFYWRDRFEFIEAPNVHMRFGGAEKAYPQSFGGTLWLSTLGVRMMKKDGIDLFWGPRQLLPPIMPRRIKTVLTVHDLTWRLFPETVAWYDLLMLKLLAERSITSADHIVAVSEATARSLRELLHVPADKITVIHNAADGYAPLDKERSAHFVAEKYGISENYALTVSTVEPRKNLSMLFRALARLRPEFQLIIAGASGWRTSPIRGAYDEAGLTEKEVKFLGYVPDEDMNRLYSGARLFVFPSLYEGFGIPPLEAMASGTAVISSNSSSLPEVVGTAGILLEPTDVDSWCDAMRTLMRDETKRADYQRRGLEQAARFSWQGSAKRLMKVFSEVTSPSGRRLP